MATRPMTADELLFLSLPDTRTELVRGRLIVREPAGTRHGAVANRTAGAGLVWVVDTERDARVYRADGTETLLGADGILGGEDLLPGFVCPLRELSFAT